MQLTYKFKKHNTKFKHVIKWSWDQRSVLEDRSAYPIKLRTEVVDWLQSSIGKRGVHYQEGEYQVLFTTKEDAIAFKLAWA